MAKKSNKLNKNIKGSKKVGEDGLFNWLNQPLKKPIKPITLGSTPKYDWGQNAEIGNEKLADQYIKSTAPGQFFTTVDTQAEVLPNTTVTELDKSITSGTPFEKSDVVNNRKRSPFENIKRNEAITFGLAGVDAYLRKNQAIRDQYNYNKRLSNTLTQKPITDVNYWRGPGSNQGSQYQSLIMAKDGAQIRKTASPNFGDVEVEGGEFIQLPDLTTQHVQGPSHAKGGVHTSLPEGSRVFSDFLKPVGGKKTYAQLAKKYDTAQYKKILDNPYANQIDRNTAKKMFDRNESILNELFQDQQIQNGNSDGTDQAAEMAPEMMAKFGLDLKKGEKLSFTDPFEYGGEYMGGYAEFQDGGEYLEEDYYVPNRSVTYSDAVENNEEVADREIMYGQMGMTNSNWSLPSAEEKLFQNFYNTLPNNLKTDDDTYNIRGYWDGLGRPKEFDYSQPKDSDGYYHAFSRHPRTGMLLKSPAHPTYQMAIQGDKAAGYSFALDPSGNVYSFKPEDMPTEGYFANYQDGGMFPADSTFYGATPGDTSVLPLGTKKIGDAKFQNGGEKTSVKETITEDPNQTVTELEKIITSSPELQKRFLELYKKEFPDSAAGIPELIDALKTFTANITAIRSKASEPELKDTNLDLGNKNQKYKELAKKYGVSPIEDENLIKRFQGAYRALATIQAEPEFKEVLKDYELTPIGVDDTKWQGSLYSGKGISNPDGWFGNTTIGQLIRKKGSVEEPTKEVKKQEIKKPELPEEGPQQFPQTSYGLKGPGWKPMPSTMGKFPAYQAAPEAFGFLAGINPYSYYTPDYTHYEVAPPTLNIDAEIQSIDDTIAALSAQTTGNASVDNARRVGLANQALQAKQQAFQRKQNYDAEARFKADIYNTDARTKENYLDVNAANTVFNEYMAGAQDAAEMERMAAISGLTNKLGK
jgi:hypothetical protein